jgi:hypothetical protein
VGVAALTSFITLYAREGADGQAVVCPLLRGSSPTRGVAPKQHRVACLSLTHLDSLTRARARFFLIQLNLRGGGDSGTRCIEFRGVASN